MKVQQVRLVEKLGKEGYHYDMNELFEPITKTITDISQNLLGDTKSNAKVFENLDESNIYVKTLESMNENEVIHSGLSKPIAKLLVTKTKVQFRLLDDPYSDNWNDYKMNG